MRFNSNATINTSNCDGGDTINDSGDEIVLACHR
jgi:hypothetical protein